MSNRFVPSDAERRFLASRKAKNHEAKPCAAQFRASMSLMSDQFQELLKDVRPADVPVPGQVGQYADTLVSGGLGGSLIQLGWHNSAGGNFWTYALLADAQAGTSLAGRTRTARAVMRRPAGFTGTFSSQTLRVFANEVGAGGVRQAKQIIFHRIRIRPATEEELGRGEVAAAVRSEILVDYLTSVQTTAAVAALRESLRVDMGGSFAAVSRSASAIANLSGSVARFSNVVTVDGQPVGAGFEAVAFNQEGGSTGTLLRLIGDNIVAMGTLSADRLVVGLGKNLLMDPEFLDGLDNWVGAFDAGHVLRVTAAGASGAHPSYPALAVAQLAASTEPPAAYYRPTATEAGGKAPGAPITGGQYYCMSAYVRVSGSGANGARVGIQWRNAAGTYITGVPTAPAYAPTGFPGLTDPDKWVRMHWIAQAPASAMYAEPFVQKEVNTGAFTQLHIWKPQLEETHRLAIGPSPWSGSGTTYINGGRMVTDSLAARAVSTETMRALNGRFGSLEAANVKIANGEIDTAHIRELSVDRLRIAGGAASTFERAYTANNVGVGGSYQSAQQLTYVIARPGPQIVFFRFTLSTGSSENVTLRILRTNGGATTLVYQTSTGTTSNPFGSGFFVDTEMLSGQITYGAEFIKSVGGTVQIIERFIGVLNSAK